MKVASIQRRLSAGVIGERREGEETGGENMASVAIKPEFRKSRLSIMSLLR